MIHYHLIMTREALVTRPTCSRPNSSPHTPHIHNTLTHSCSPSPIRSSTRGQPHSQIHIHPHTFTLTHAHTRIHTHTHAQSPALWPLCLLFLCQERLCWAPLTSSAARPPPGSPPCLHLASPSFLGRSACPMHFVIGDRSREGTAQVLIQHLPLLAAGGCWEGVQGPPSPRSEGWSL